MLCGSLFRERHRLIRTDPFYIRQPGISLYLVLMVGLKEAAVASSKATVLVVDDERDVREATAHMLQAMGFRVLEASSGPEAVEVCDKHKWKIDLLLADLIMPGMTGRVLADILTAQCHGLKVIFMSGYVDDSRGETLEQGLHYIQKPLRWKKLEQIISDVLKKKKNTA
jgi:CheY-like chemotaxis protein